MKLRSGTKVVIVLAPPIEDRHGIKRGRAFEIIDPIPLGLSVRRGALGWVMGDAKEPVLLLNHEAREE